VEVLLVHLLKVAVVSGVITWISIFGIVENAQAVLTPTNELIAQQQSPASTYQPGFWQPVARVNPQESVNVNIVNQSGIAIEYSLTTGPMETRTVANGGETQLANLAKDSYIVINPQSTSSALKFQVTTDNNLVNVTVLPSSDFSGESTVHIHPTGAIYKY
jgi:serine/threonine-protein kinase